MHYISKLNHPSIKTLQEIIDIKYDNKENDYNETNKTVYRVDQNAKFFVDKNIEGRVWNRQKERTEINGNISFSEIIYLEIFSSKLKITELEAWVESRLKEYENYLKVKSFDSQLLIEVTYNTKDKDVDLYYVPFESNVRFENRFFSGKDNIINKINFFINNPDWYKKRGIPHTLGFLLWGEPGCGKTGFIKALMNLTGRHGISFKLNNKFDLSRLRELIYDDELGEDLIIPQDKRILIFEDIDCMGDVVKDRDKIKPSEPLNQITTIDNKKKTDTLETISLIEHLEQGQNPNNNLSYFLNILDGLQECPGRIIVMTTNKPDILDPALIRPGRIDFNINFTKATIQDIESICNFYWFESDDKNKMVSDYVLSDFVNLKYSHAEIVNFCRTSNTFEDTIKKIINE
jgi:chaperone BCS1